MRDANKAELVLLSLCAALTACRQAPADHNTAIGNEAAAPTEIEALPPDESAATPSGEIANDDDQAANVAGPSNSD